MTGQQTRLLIIVSSLSFLLISLTAPHVASATVCDNSSSDTAGQLITLKAVKLELIRQSLMTLDSEPINTHMLHTNALCELFYFEK